MSHQASALIGTFVAELELYSSFFCPPCALSRCHQFADLPQFISKPPETLIDRPVM